MKKNRSILLVLMLTCLFIFPSNKQVIYGQSKVNTIISSESLTISDVTLNKSSFLPGEALTYVFKVSGYVIGDFWSTIKITYEDGTFDVIDSKAYSLGTGEILDKSSNDAKVIPTSSTYISGSFYLPIKIGIATINIQINKYYKGIIYMLPNDTESKSITILEETLSASNLTLNQTSFNPGETLTYSYNVIADFITGYEIYSHVSIRYADGSLDIIDSKTYDANTTSISGTFVMPSKIGGAAITVQISKYKKGQIYQYPSTVILTKNFTITAEYLSISNVAINKTNYNTGESLTYSYQVSGDLITGAQIWSDVKIIYADGSSSQLENESNSSYNTTYSGSFTLPEKIGAATLHIKVNKYYNSTIQASPSASTSKDFTISEAATPGTATISNILYKNSWTGLSNLYIYNGEGINLEFDLDNTGETDVNVIVYTIWTTSDVSEYEMVSNNIINSYYFQNNRINNYNIGDLSAGAWTYVTLCPYVGNVCPSSGNYILWTFTCDNNDDKVFDFEQKNFTFSENNRLKIIIDDKQSKTNEIITDFNALKIYPNPSTGQIHLEANESLKDYTVDVYSLTGAKIYSCTLEDSENTIDLSNLETGLYIIKLEKDEVIYHQKIQIKK